MKDSLKYSLFDKTGKSLLADAQGRFYTSDLLPVSVVLFPSYDIARLQKLIAVHIDKKCFQIELLFSDNSWHALVGFKGLLDGSDHGRR